MRAQAGMCVLTLALQLSTMQQHSRRRSEDMGVSGRVDLDLVDKFRRSTVLLLSTLKVLLQVLLQAHGANRAPCLHSSPEYRVACLYRLFLLRTAGVLGIMHTYTHAHVHSCTPCTPHRAFHPHSIPHQCVYPPALNLSAAAVMSRH